MFAQAAEKSVKPVARLRQWDIVRSFGFGSRQKECVVAAPPIIMGDRVRLTLHPMAKHFNKKRVKSFNFWAHAGIEVLGQQELKTFLQEHIELVRTVLREGEKAFPQDIFNRLRDRGVQCSKYGVSVACKVLGAKASRSEVAAQYSQRAIASVLAALSPGESPIDCGAIAHRISKKKQTLALMTIRDTCRELAQRGELIAKSQGKSLRYRLPLSNEAIGMPVIFCCGSPSEMVGWVERYQRHANGKEYPVVRLITGKELFASDDTIDPLDSAIAADGVRKIRDGCLEEPPIALDREIFESLREASTVAQSKASGTAYAGSIRKAAIALGFAFEHDGPRYFCKARVETVDYLNRYYPGWKYGLNTQELWGEAFR